MRERTATDVATDKNLRKGDKVEWSSHGGKAEGKVEKKLTDDTKIKGQQIRASKDDPRYLVKSEKSGAKAAHRAGALKKKG